MIKTPKTKRRRRLLIRLAELQENLCFHCGEPMAVPEPDAVYENGVRNGEEVASYDHLFPRALGGQGGFNLVIAHRGCNSKRGHSIPTVMDMERLQKLNAKRQHLFTAEHGRISAASFGEVSSSSIVLAEVLNDLTDKNAAQQRHLACRFMSLFYRDVRALDQVKANSDWYRLVSLIRNHHLRRLYASDCSISPKDFVANVVHSIVNNRIQLRKLCETLTVDV